MLTCPPVGEETVKVTGVPGTGVVIRRVEMLRGWAATVSMRVVWELPETREKVMGGREVDWVGLLLCRISNPSVKPSPSVSGRSGWVLN
jgi:hypothetical protein